MLHDDLTDTVPPRLPWTGERCTPEADDIHVVYEHLHRYQFAARLVGGRSVLDLGSGEGYGTALLARTAADVVGVEVDSASIAHSRAKYRAGNLAFHEGSALSLDRFDDKSFDVVVCFEVIEHVEDQERLIREVRRVLTHEGLFFVSTPNRDVYNEGRQDPNPFHVKELSQDELLRLLTPDFPHVAVWGQTLSVGSELVLRGQDEASVGAYGVRIAVQKTGHGWTESVARPPVYLVCLASAVQLPERPSFSLLADESLHLLRRHERRASVLERQAIRVRHQLADADGRTREEEQVLALVTALRAWRLISYLGAFGSRRHRLLTRLIAFGGGRWPSRSHAPEIARRIGRPDAGSIRFIPVTDPLVSVVMPVCDNLALTLRSLVSLQAHAEASFEVIVVDDASAAETAGTLAAIKGLRIERNDENLGFVHSCNRGARVANGRYILFLNNDVEVQDGWLDALVRAMQSAPDVAVVGSKLLYPDGRLQEAGALIWSDATGWNYGRGADPSAPEFNYRRDVDYCSGAALMVRRDVFAELGGFDTRFTPAYYEDTDLCFAAREAGYRVLYEPQSAVVHHEGASYGTEKHPRSGAQSKSVQVHNRHVFSEKWSAVLAHHRHPGSAAGRLGGRCSENLRVLVADIWVPAPDRDSGSMRMTWLLRLLRSLGCEVTLFPQDRIGRQPYTNELQAEGIEVCYGATSFTKFARERAGEYDCVILSRPDVASEYMDAVWRYFPAAVKLYDTVDLHHVREGRRRELSGVHEDGSVQELREIELGCMRRCDLIVAITDDEARAIRCQLSDSRIVVLPNVHEVSGSSETYDFDKREDLLFIGSFQHHPNVDAVLHFADDIEPLLAPDLDVRLWVVGSSPPGEIRALQSPSTVVTGYVADADSYFRSARVFVAPLRYGAGMKGKIGHSLALGLPVVTTSFGAEGMDLHDGQDVLIRDDPEGFASAVALLYNDRELWRKLARNGQEITRERWSPDSMRSRLQLVLDEIRTQIGTPVAARRA